MRWKLPRMSSWQPRAAWRLRFLTFAYLLIVAAVGMGMSLALPSRLTLLYGRESIVSQAELSPLSQPLARSWPAISAWSEKLEQEYEEFVEHLGQAVAARRCRTLEACLRSPEINLLFDPWTDARLELDVDCGDLPYVLRGYFAFKRRLPFGFVCEVQGIGPHVRYMSAVTPLRFCTWNQYATPKMVLRKMIGQVHSGMYRMAPEVETADFYPVEISRRALHAGAVYYDPNGHVLVVGEVREDGTVYLMDGHPDGSLTWKRFGEAFALGGRSQGGGFKRFRPQQLHSGGVVRAQNRELPFFDGRSQWDRTLWQAPDKPGSYHAWVREALAMPESPRDPVADFRDQLRALCRDISDRVSAVEAAVSAGLPARPHPGELPENIYGTTGEWELYASPSRDARLKAAFRELYESLSGLARSSALVAELRGAWREETAQPACRFAYRNSEGAAVPLSFEDVLDRLFLLSFDPYHCPELRWGAGGAERSSCPADAKKWDMYLREQRLRNRLDRDYGAPTPLSAGPEESPDLDARVFLGLGH